MSQKKVTQKVIEQKKEIVVSNLLLILSHQDGGYRVFFSVQIDTTRGCRVGRNLNW